MSNGAFGKTDTRISKRTLRAQKKQAVDTLGKVQTVLAILLARQPDGTATITAEERAALGPRPIHLDETNGGYVVRLVRT